MWAHLATAARVKPTQHSSLAALHVFSCRSCAGFSLRARFHSRQNEAFAKALNAAPASPNPPAWRNRRNTGYPELDESIRRRIDLSTPPDPEHVSENADYPQLSMRTFLRMEDVRPGDFVEARRTGKTYMGVVLPMPEENDAAGSGQGSSIALVVATGELEQVRATDVMLQLPGFIDEALVYAAAPLRRPDQTPGAVAGHSSDVFSDDIDSTPPNTLFTEEPFDYMRFATRAKICGKIRTLQRETDREIRRLYPALRTLFLLQAGDMAVDETVFEHREQHFRALAQDMLRRGSVLTMQVVQLLEQYLASPGRDAPRTQFKASTVMATHVLLMGHPAQFLADATSHRRSQLFTYRSLHEQQILKRVAEWVRASTSGVFETEQEAAAAVLDGFCERVKYVLEWHAKQDKIDTPIPKERDHVPAIHGEGLFEWTETDRDIIEFLKISLGNRRELQEDTTGSLAMSIIKRMGLHIRLAPIMHPNMTDQTNVPPICRDAFLDSMISNITTAGSDLQHALVYGILVRIGALVPWENPSALDTHLRNIHHTSLDIKEHILEEERALREEFHAPVYVIDSAAAFELDDGVSVEPAETPEEHWVHVHVADPSAWIRPDHPLATEAEYKYSSVYFPETMWPLFPKQVAYKGMSLTDGNSMGQAVMSFSARVHAPSGKVLEYKVRRGRIHNVKILNYQEVNHYFSNGFPPKNAHDTMHNEKTQNDLSILAKLASKICQRRVQVGRGVNAWNNPAEVTISPQPLPSLANVAATTPIFFAGFPTVDVRLTNHTEIIKPGTFDHKLGGLTAETMVSEMMLLAGRIAASFGIQHQIPLPYRLQDEPAPADVRTIEELKDPINGALSIIELQKRNIFLPMGYSSTTPGIHYGLGIRSTNKKDPNKDALYRGGYVRVTSPLRRFPDLLTHWQLKAALDARPTYISTAGLSQMLPQFERMETWVKQLERSSHRYWVWTVVDRTLKKKDMYEKQSVPKNQREWSTLEQCLLEPQPAFIGVSDVRFNSDTLDSKIRVNLLKLGGQPVDCLWSHNKTPTRGEIIWVKIIQTIGAGAKRTIICEIV